MELHHPQPAILNKPIHILVTESLLGHSATACSPGKKIPHQQDEDHERKKQQNDIPTRPENRVMHDESLLASTVEQGSYRSRSGDAQSIFRTKDSTDSQDMVAPLPGVRKGYKKRCGLIDTASWDLRDNREADEIGTAARLTRRSNHPPSHRPVTSSRNGSLGLDPKEHEFSGPHRSNPNQHRDQALLDVALGHSGPVTCHKIRLIRLRPQQGPLPPQILEKRFNQGTELGP